MLTLLGIQAGSFAAGFVTAGAVWAFAHAFILEWPALRR